MKSLEYSFSVSAYYIQDSFEYDCLTEDNCLKVRKNQDLITLVFGENLKDKHFKKSFLQKMNKEELKDLFYNLDLGYNCDDYTKTELIADLLYITSEQYYNAIIKSQNWHDIESDYISRGYSQGDAVHVIFHTQEWDTPEQRSYINNCLWNCTVSAHLVITAKTQDGFSKTVETIAYSECQNDSFSYNAKDFYDYVLKNSTDEAWHNQLKIAGEKVFEAEIKY